MSRQVSINLRYLLWRRQVPRAEWEAWLSRNLTIERGKIRALVEGRLQDSEIDSDQLLKLNHLLELGEEEEILRFANLPADRCSILLENLRFLLGSLERGGKKQLAMELCVDPTTISRWLNGTYEPQASSLRQLGAYFGLPPATDLTRDPVFLESSPVALTDRRIWVQRRIEKLSAEEFREIYPALRRLLEER